jgi:hypothetical protein
VVDVDDVVEGVGVASTAVVVDATVMVVAGTTVVGGASTSDVGTTGVDALSVPTVPVPPVHADTRNAPRTTEVTMLLIR